MIHRSAWQGLDTLLIDTPLARCEIALFGAQVLSFTPRADGRDLLWYGKDMEAIYYNQQPGRPIQGMIQFPLAPGQNTIGDQRWFLFFCEKFLPGNIEPSKLIQLEVSVKLTGDIVTVRGS